MRKLLDRCALWLVFNVPMGRLAPHVLGFALHARPKRVRE